MKNIHIGSLIEEKLKESKMTVAKFAKAIHCSRTNVYDIFERESIDMKQLVLISEVLNYDFIREVYIGDEGDVGSEYIVIIKGKLEVIERFLSENACGGEEVEIVFRQKVAP